MKLIKQSIDTKLLSGYIILEPQDPEDMWHIYNLMRSNDYVTATSTRKITQTFDTGTTKNLKKVVKLKLRVTTLAYDPQASQLRVSGIVSNENLDVSLGTHHTHTLDLNRSFTLHKPPGGWDSVATQQLHEAVAASNAPHAYALLLGPDTALLYRLTAHRTLLAASLSTTLPGKRGAAADQDAARTRFHARVLSATLLAVGLTPASASSSSSADTAATTSVDPHDLPPLLVASPGFSAAQFAAYVKRTAAGSSASGSQQKALQALQAKLVVAHAASAAPSGLASVLSGAATQGALADARFLRETALVDAVYAAVRRDDGRAWYGGREVQRAVAAGAVGAGGGVLLVTGRLFRSEDVRTRRRWVGVVDRVRAMGGEARILSEAHESGKRLEALGGVAALLVWPMFDLDEDDEEGEQQDEDLQGIENGQLEEEWVPEDED